jgi:hypothetical protein
MKISSRSGIAKSHDILKTKIIPSTRNGKKLKEITDGAMGMAMGTAAAMGTATSKPANICKTVDLIVLKAAKTNSFCSLFCTRNV